MQIETRQAEHVLIVTPLEACLDVRVAAEFRTALIDRIDAGSRWLVVNLSHVSFMDSSALGAIVSALKRIGQNGELRVCAPAAPVRRMFVLTRLDRVIPVLDREDETLASFPPFIEYSNARSTGIATAG